MSFTAQIEVNTAGITQKNKKYLKKSSLNSNILSSCVKLASHAPRKTQTFLVDHRRLNIHS